MEEQLQIAVKEAPVEGKPARMLMLRIADVTFLLFLAVLCVQYYFTISTYQVPMWDAAAYLTNARDWLTNLPLYEIYRPPLISWFVAAIWFFTGENWIYAKPLAAAFTVGAGILLYACLRKGKGNLFALGVTMLTMLNSLVFFYGSQIYPEGISLFFVVATLYFLKSEKPTYWLLAGACVGLTFASRYPIVLQAAVLAVVESYARKNWRMLARAIVGAVPAVVVVVLIVFLKTGTFQTALPKDTIFTVFLSPYYLQNAVVTWGWISLLVPLAFVLRGTYADRYNYVFIAWFVLSMVFWSANATNEQLRFTIQFTPAVNFLALLPVASFVKNKEPILGFLKKEMVFIPKRHEDIAVESSLSSEPNKKTVVTDVALDLEDETIKKSTSQAILKENGAVDKFSARWNSTSATHRSSRGATLLPSVSCKICGRRIARDDRYCDQCGSSTK